MKYYQRLKDIREDRDKSQEEIAELLQTTRQQYARWENGQYQTPVEVLKALAQYYNISIDYLVGLISKPKTLDGKPYRITKNITINNDKSF